MDNSIREKNMTTRKRDRSEVLHKCSSTFSVIAIVLVFALFARIETVARDSRTMDSKLSLQIQQIRDVLKESSVFSRGNENLDISNAMIRDKIHVVRRSVDTVNGNESISYRDLGEAIKKYVRSIMKEYICQSPDRVCVAGPPGPTGVRGLPGKRGPKGIRGKKGTRGVMGPPGKPGKQGVKGDIGPEGVKGEKGNPGTPGQPGAKGEPGESLSAPKVTVSPTSNTVTENQTSTFYCSANGNPAPTVTWSKTGGTELIAGRHNKLEIRNATYNDSGNYVCTAKSILGGVRKQVKLLVEVPPRFTKIPNRVITVKRGAKASVSCQAFGFPSPNIVWSRGLVPLPQGRTSLSNGTLEILYFGPKDSGTYQCTVSNKLGSVSVLTSLNYKQTDFKATFTNLGASGRFGPTSLGGHYTGQDHDGQVALSDGIQQWTVLHTGDYRIIAIGAAGGYDIAINSALYRGRGARMIGIFSLNQGEVIQILIGQEGGINKNAPSSGGGGGTFVVRGANKPLIIAGGGGGIESASSRHSGCDARSGSSGNPGYKSWSGGSNGHGAQTADSDNSGGGGGGFYSSGRSSKQFGGTMGTGGEGGKGFLQGGVGGRANVNNVVGGFGGGAGAYGNGGGGGGGGGYSGGSSGDNVRDSCGGGGGSYNAGKNQQNECCYRSSGHGQVIITEM